MCKMGEKSASCTKAKISLALSVIFLVFSVLLLGALVQVKVLLTEQMEMINRLQGKTDCMLPCKYKIDPKKEPSTSDLSKKSRLKSKTRRDVSSSTKNNTASQSLQDLYSSIEKVLANQGRSGPPGPPGRPGPAGPIGPPGIKWDPPKVSLPEGPIYVKEGDDLSLPCHVTGSPTPKIAWSKIMRSLRQLWRRRSIIRAGRLLIKTVQVKDSGLYACTGSSSLGSAIETVKIVIVPLPKFITTPPLKIKKELNDTLTLDCHALAGSNPVLTTWSKENGRLPSDRTRLIDGMLKITALQTTDAGKYVCTATSQGVATSTIITTVRFHDVDGIKFHRESITDYIVVKRTLPRMTKITLCLWMMTTDTNPKDHRSMISYAVPGSDNQILLNNHKSLIFHIANKAWFTKVSVNDGKWHHICATWDNAAGQAALYKDGVRRAQGRISRRHVTKSPGSLIIGQEQDIVGGGFSKSQSYVGELTGINMWNRVLGPREISAMSKSCETSASGNVLTMNDVISGIKRGQVRIVPSTCMA